MIYVRSFLAIAIVGLVLLAGGVSPVSAQGAAKKPEAGNGLKIAPVRTDLTIEKGTNRTVVMTVENITSTAVTVRGVTNDFVPSTDESGEPRIILDEKQSAPGNSFKSLVTPIVGMTLQPNERREVRIALNIPATAASGGYYGAIRFAPGTGDNDKNVALTASVGSIFLIRVPGAITEKLSVESFAVAHDGQTSSLFNGGPLTVVTRFRNFGNIHVQPFGKIYVKNTAGKTIQDMEINNVQPRGSVLPASIRKFENPIKEQKLFGRYTIEGNFGYGSNGDLLLAKKTVYVVPYKLIGGIILVLAFLIFGLPKLIRKYNENIINKAAKAKKRKR